MFWQREGSRKTNQQLKTRQDNHTGNMQRTCTALMVQHSHRNVFQFKGDRKCWWRWQRLITGSNTSNQDVCPARHTFSSCYIVHLSSINTGCTNTDKQDKMQIISEDHFTVSCDWCVQSTEQVQTKRATLSETQRQRQMIYLKIHHLRLLKDAHGCSPLFWRATE